MEARRPLYSGGPEVSVLGFGASPLGGVFSAIDEDTGVASVHEASRLGINFFDCSPCVTGGAGCVAFLSPGKVTRVDAPSSRHAATMEIFAQRLCSGVL